MSAASQSMGADRPSAAALQRAFEHGVWYTVALWPALHVAVQNSWGGSASADKRDWLAGVVSELVVAQPETDQEDIEVLLLQIMEDEFECRVEDETECTVANTIMRLRTSVLVDGDLGVYRELETRWRNRGAMKADIRVTDQTDGEGTDEEEWQGFGDDDDEGDGDVDMDEAPQLVPAQVSKAKVEPEVDEDGFVKVVGKKKR